jgi:glutathione peroxidase
MPSLVQIPGGGSKKMGVDDPINGTLPVLVDENGKLVQVFGSKVVPTSEDITKHLN